MVENDLGGAIAEAASLIFKQIRFVEYGRRAEALTALLGAWRRLELGALSTEVAIQVGDEGHRLAGMLGEKRWTHEKYSSLAEADAKLRRLMKIPRDVRLPLIAD
jgi:hypothetical protein